MPHFDELPFRVRPDLSPFLIHFTKNSETDDEYTAFDNLCNILETGEIWGTHRFVRGSNKATCFMDVPFMSLKYIFTEENTKRDRPRYEPYGILVAKQHAYRKGARPVLYMSNKECLDMKIPRAEWWRVVRLYADRKGNWISWLHEREWRKKGDFPLPSTCIAALVDTSSEARKLTKLILSENYKCKPRAVIPLSIVCQGLTLM